MKLKFMDLLDITNRIYYKYESLHKMYAKFYESLHKMYTKCMQNFSISKIMLTRAKKKWDNECEYEYSTESHVNVIRFLISISSQK